MFCDVKIAGNVVTQHLHIVFISQNVKNIIALTNSNTIEK